MAEVVVRFAWGRGIVLAVHRARVCPTRLIALGDQERRRHQQGGEN
ncbi:MAG: hypothetical protein ACREMF_01495 [Gemmatimonadales bacterium]